LVNGVVVVVRDALAFLEFKEIVNVGDDGGLLGQSENVGAEVEDLGGHIRVSAVDQADHRNYGGNSDDHSNEREHAAELMRPEAGGGDGDGFGQLQLGRTSHRIKGISSASLLGIRERGGLNYGGNQRLNRCGEVQSRGPQQAF
jgi:hypothetical protein